MRQSWINYQVHGKGNHSHDSNAWSNSLFLWQLRRRIEWFLSVIEIPRPSRWFPSPVLTIEIEIPRKIMTDSSVSPSTNADGPTEAIVDISPEDQLDPVAPPKAPQSQKRSLAARAARNKKGHAKLEARRKQNVLTRTVHSSWSVSQIKSYLRHSNISFGQLQPIRRHLARFHFTTDAQKLVAEVQLPHDILDEQHYSQWIEEHPIWDLSRLTRIHQKIDRCEKCESADQASPSYVYSKESWWLFIEQRDVPYWDISEGENPLNSGREPMVHMIKGMFTGQESQGKSMVVKNERRWKEKRKNPQANKTKETKEFRPRWRHYPLKILDCYW